MISTLKEVREALHNSQAFVEASSNQKLHPGWGSQLDEAEAALYKLDALIAAQEKAEPVAWVYEGEPSFDGNKWHEKKEVTTSLQVAQFKSGTIKKPTPLYTTPQSAAEPLTDEQIQSLWDGHAKPVFSRTFINPIVFARAIEAAHKIGAKP